MRINYHTKSIDKRDTFNYYPFGLVMEGDGMASAANNTEPHNNYHYNGKELQPETQWLDFAARFYQPEIAKWTNVDPLSALYPSLTGYRFGFNNPINFGDPSGMVEVGHSSGQSIWGATPYAPIPMQSGDNLIVGFDLDLSPMLDPIIRQLMLGGGGGGGNYGIVGNGPFVHLSQLESPEQLTILFKQIMQDFEKFRGRSIFELIDYSGYDKYYDRRYTSGKFIYDYKPKVFVRPYSVWVIGAKPNESYTVTDIAYGLKPNYLSVKETIKDGKPYYEFTVDKEKISGYQKRMLTAYPDIIEFRINVWGQKGDNFHDEVIMSLGFGFEQIKIFEKYANKIGIDQAWLN